MPAAPLERASENIAGAVKPAVLNAEAFVLPHELIPEIRALSRLRPCYTLGVIGVNWLVILAGFTAAVHFPDLLVWLGVALVIATRQNALLVLMHEAVHGRLLPDRRWGDRLSNWFCAYPFLISTGAFRCDHLAHHSHVNTADDPDLVRKMRRPQAWVFPKTKKALVASLLAEMLGLGFLDFIRHTGSKRFSSRKVADGPGVSGPTWRSYPWERIGYYGVVATGITLGNLWLAVLCLWLVPYVTVLPVLIRVRSIAEHFGLPGDHELNMTRNTVCPLWEQVVIAPHGINYHLDHHLFPSVPYYNLPRLHRVLLGIPAYRANACLAESYIGWTGKSVLMQVTVPVDVAGCANEALAPGNG